MGTMAPCHDGMVQAGTEAGNADELVLSPAHSLRPRLDKLLNAHRTVRPHAPGELNEEMTTSCWQINPPLDFLRRPRHDLTAVGAHSTVAAPPTSPTVRYTHGDGSKASAERDRPEGDRGGDALSYPNPLVLRGGGNPGDRPVEADGSTGAARWMSNDHLEGVRLGLGQLQLGSVEPEPVPPAAVHAEASEVAGNANKGERLQLPELEPQQATRAVAASAPPDQQRLAPPTKQHWIHPTRRRSPYEYLHEHDADPTEEEKLRREKEKDRIMRQCIAEHKARMRRAMIPVLDLTGENSSEEERADMEIDG
ncbi:hypothetical protein JCM3774_005978 [Rhodotorula dairenensis]